MIKHQKVVVLVISIPIMHLAYAAAEVLKDNPITLLNFVFEIVQSAENNKKMISK